MSHGVFKCTPRLSLRFSLTYHQLSIEQRDGEGETSEMVIIKTASLYPLYPQLSIDSQMQSFQMNVVNDLFKPILIQPRDPSESE
jgi:hypothetical protein